MMPERKIIGELILGYRKAKVLFTAASLGLFSAARRPATAARIAAALGRADLRATRVFLDSLAAMGFLVKTGQRYRNSAMAAKYLVPGRKEYLGHNLQYQDLLWEAWSGLGKVIKTGRPPVALEKLLSGRSAFIGEYIRGMSEIARRPAAEVAAALDLEGVRDVLDVGGGPGTYSLALLARMKAREARATILDLAPTLRVTAGLLAGHRLRRRVELRAGNYHEADFGRGRYDLVLLSHVTHDEGPADNLRLLRKAFAALRPGGSVVIHDFMLDAAGTAPLFSALFSVHMLVYTRNGGVYTAGEYAAWLKRAGFSGVAGRTICADTGTPTRIITARKA